MQAHGVIIGKYIELVDTTNFPDGLLVTVDIHSDSSSLKKKQSLVNELCGSWANDDSLNAVFSEMDDRRHNSRAREVIFDAAS